MMLKIQAIFIFNNYILCIYKIEKLFITVRCITTYYYMKNICVPNQSHGVKAISMTNKHKTGNDIIERTLVNPHDCNLIFALVVRCTPSSGATSKKRMWNIYEILI